MIRRDILALLLRAGRAIRPAELAKLLDVPRRNVENTCSQMHVNGVLAKGPAIGDGYEPNVFMLPSDVELIRVMVNAYGAPRVRRAVREVST